MGRSATTNRKQENAHNQWRWQNKGGSGSNVRKKQDITNSHWQWRWQNTGLRTVESTEPTKENKEDNVEVQTIRNSNRVIFERTMLLHGSWGTWPVGASHEWRMQSLRYCNTRCTRNIQFAAQRRPSLNWMAYRSSGGKIARVQRSINDDTLVRDRRDHQFCRLLSSLLLWLYQRYW